jgi:hypothetical protein
MVSTLSHDVPHIALRFLISTSRAKSSDFAIDFGFRAPFELLFGRNFIINLVHVGGFFCTFASVERQAVGMK